MKTAIVFLLTVCFGLIQNASADPALMLVGNKGNPEQGSGGFSHKREIGSQNSSGNFALTDQEISIDFLDDGVEVTAITFEIAISENSVADLSNCVSNVPETHTAVCERNEDVIRLAVFSMANAPLETTSFGTIRVSNNSGPLKIQNASFADSNGNSVSADVL